MRFMPFEDSSQSRWPEVLSGCAREQKRDEVEENR
jgi:hypothetical protein